MGSALVLCQSKRLDKTRKIVCITYTNVAVETILERLGTSIGRVEVSTIHSFLYNHIIKPYIKFIADEYKLNVVEIDGHDDHIVSMKNVVTWIENHQNSDKLKHPYTVNQLTRLDQNKVALRNWINSLKYTLAPDETLEIVSKRNEAYCTEEKNGKLTRRILGKSCLDILETDLIAYKYLYWQEGILHHDDVLFFSYQLIQKYPFILKVIRAKFPYFFVDEFQDTNPIQTKIVEQIGKEETTVGIIGDKAQSIYSFQGAVPSQFSSFSLPDIAEYGLLENRRSTNQIVDFLNSIRSDITQKKPANNLEGDKPMMIVGQTDLALKKVQEICKDEEICSLSRDNFTANAIRRKLNPNISNEDLIQKLYDIDSNSVRRRLITTYIKVTELSQQNLFKDAIKELEKLNKTSSDKLECKNEALKYLKILTQNYDDFKDKSLFDFYLFVQNKIYPKITKLARGGIKEFYENYKYQQLALCVKISNDQSLNRTIHKAKGAEFKNVILILKNVSDLEFLLKPNLDKEEHGVNYVAVSRAREKLFILVPDISKLNTIENQKLHNLLNVIQL